MVLNFGIHGKYMPRLIWDFITVQSHIWLQQKKKQLMRWSFSNEDDDDNKKGEKNNKSSIKSPGGAYFKHICRGAEAFLI